MPGAWKSGAFAHTRPADGALRDAERWLRENADRPFFLWVHLFEPHMPYESHEAPFDVFTYEESDELKRSERDAPERAVPFYDSEIRYADDAVGELIALLAELGVDDETVIVAVGDHGEHMSEQRAGRDKWFTHSEVYEEVCRVPLIVRLAPARSVRGCAPGSVATELVSVMDLGPALLDLAGVADPRSGSAGRSFLPLLRGAAWAARPVIVLAKPHAGLDTRVIRTSRWKLVARPGGSDELYDLENDPLELVNLAASLPSRRDSLRALLSLAVESWPSSAEESRLDPQAREMLRALGYVN